MKRDKLFRLSLAILFLWTSFALADTARNKLIVLTTKVYDYDLFLIHVFLLIVYSLCCCFTIFETSRNCCLPHSGVNNNKNITYVICCHLIDYVKATCFLMSL